MGSPMPESTLSPSQGFGLWELAKDGLHILRRRANGFLLGTVLYINSLQRTVYCMCVYAPLFKPKNSKVFTF